MKIATLVMLLALPVVAAEKAPLPKKVSEVIALRFQVAKMKAVETAKAAQEASAAAQKALDALKKDGQLGPKDDVNFDTLEITRAPVETVAPAPVKSGKK